MRRILYVAAMIGMLAVALSARAADPLKVVKSFKAANGGSCDYISCDPDARRIYVSHGTEAVVLDADTGTTVGTIADCPGIHGIALVPELHLGFTSNGRGNSLTVFDTQTLKTIKTLKAGQNPDAIMYDPFSKKVMAFNHSGGDITIVDTTALDKDPVQLPCGGALEAGVSDGKGKVYLNVEDKSEIAVIDAKENKITARWPVAPAEGPSGLAIDAERGRLYAGCGGNNMMAILDTATGKVLTTLPIDAGVDGCAYSPKMKLAASSNGSGTLTAIAEEPAGTFKVVQTLPTANRAKTIAYDSKTNVFYLPYGKPLTGTAMAAPTPAPAADANATPAAKKGKGGKGGKGKGGKKGGGGPSELMVMTVGAAE